MQSWICSLKAASSRRQCRSYWRDLRVNPPLQLLPSPNANGSEGQSQSKQDAPTTPKDNQKSSNPSEERGNKKEKGKAPSNSVSSFYSRQDDLFTLEDDKDEKFRNQAFLQREGGLSPLDPVLPADYEDLSRRVHGVRLDPDCVWKKVNGFKREYAKEVTALKKTFVCLETSSSLKILSAYEELKENRGVVSLEDVIYDLCTSTLATMYTILNRRKFLYSLSNTSKDVVKIFSFVRGNRGDLNRQEQEDLLFTAKMARE
jgi:hypothetical protein